MNNTRLARPAQKAVRTQSSILFWLLLWGTIGFGLLYSSIELAIDSDGFQVGSVMLSVIGILILAIYPARYIKELTVAKELERNGASTSGEIIDKWINKHRGKGTNKQFFVAYKFGNDYGAVQRVSSSIYKNLEVGDVVTVRYISSDPKKSCIETSRI